MPLTAAMMVRDWLVWSVNGLRPDISNMGVLGGTRLGMDSGCATKMRAG